MATIANLAQFLEDCFRDGLHFSVTKVVRSPESTDVVEVPQGVKAAGHVTSLPEDTGSSALTVDSISQQAVPSPCQVTVSGGTTGATYYVIAIHVGNAAGL